ncbi:hypothetical protein NITMOv2_2999 [Nitrospira moscoviensis]|uniref:Uncharacterized protein n=1 Tax=Nitrospira moscoviensis TaxID=42253 RepID=A0A0K2GEZ3_NITMO|nr:hypothetical protein NITMOv2_2999 [Nitrospira moscoviensis]
MRQSTTPRIHSHHSGNLPLLALIHGIAEEEAIELRSVLYRKRECLSSTSFREAYLFFNPPGWASDNAG